MSDGKSSSYRVVSAQELKRRALAAARDRVDRANDAVVGLAAELAGAEMTYGSLGVGIPNVEHSSSTEPADVESLAARLEGGVAAGRARVHGAVAAARLEHFAALARELTDALRPAEELKELTMTARPAAERSVSAQVESALRSIARLPADADAGVVKRAERLLAEIRETDSTARAETALAALRADVQAERQRAELVDQNRARVAEMLIQLDGLAGDEVARVRGLLRGLPLDAPLHADLAAHVARAREEAVNAADRRFALETTRRVLEEQGYELGEEFVTVVATENGALLPLAASARHGVRVRERAGKLFFNVVRFEGTVTGGTDDVTAATAFCDSFATIERRSAEAGLALTRVAHFDPGSGRIEVRKEASPFEHVESRRVRRSQRGRERQR